MIDFAVHSANLAQKNHLITIISGAVARLDHNAYSQAF